MALMMTKLFCQADYVSCQRAKKVKARLEEKARQLSDMSSSDLDRSLSLWQIFKINDLWQGSIREADLSTAIQESWNQFDGVYFS